MIKILVIITTRASSIVNYIHIIQMIGQRTAAHSEFCVHFILILIKFFFCMNLKLSTFINFLKTPWSFNSRKVVSSLFQWEIEEFKNRISARRFHIAWNVFMDQNEGRGDGSIAEGQIWSISILSWLPFEYRYHIMCQHLDKGNDVRAVFCDISKAFDKVWHEGFIYKLKRIRIRAPLLGWFENYFNNRQQRVVLNNKSSKFMSTNAGVPQGSVLGPTLFLVFY